MATKLYYTVQKETQEDVNLEYCTGKKSVVVYEIANDRPKPWFDVDIKNFHSSEEAINKKLKELGVGDRDYDLIEL